MINKVTAVLSTAATKGKEEAGGEIGKDASETADEGDETGARGQRLGMVIDMADASWVGGLLSGSESPRFPYSRPDFMYLVTEDDLASAGDQTTRPVLVPKDPSKMPLFAGYAETINAGKTVQNEDEATAKFLTLMQTRHKSGEAGKSESTPCPERKRADTTGDGSKTEDRTDEQLLLSHAPQISEEGTDENASKVVASYFGVFDGHAGTGASLMASNCLHEHIRERLSQVLETLLHADRQERLSGARSPPFSPNGKPLTADSMVIGALETAFVEMDDQISEEKLLWRISGGCAALVALCLLDKLYVANAGDCRALLCCRDRIQALSRDLTPSAERQRLQAIAFRQPDLLGKQFSRLEYSRFLNRKDLKKKVLYRDWYMDGWALKTVREGDLRPPLINDCARKCRLLNTIGVTRGFGDHHLMTVDDRIPIKPFLSPVPEVQVFDLGSLDSLSDRDVLVLASDGLWDVLSNEEVASIVQANLSQAEGDPTKYTLAAQDLVIGARGEPDGHGRWTLGRASASSDDISVFVIPLKHALTPSANLDDDVDLLH